MRNNILIVDNSLVIRKVLKRMLQETSLKDNSIHEASDGAEALEYLDLNSVDIVFLDINMPVMDGIEFLEEIQSKDYRDNLKIIVVSTEGSGERDKQLQDLGIVAKVLKPIRQENLTETVEQVCKNP